MQQSRNQTGARALASPGVETSLDATKSSAAREDFQV